MGKKLEQKTIELLQTELESIPEKFCKNFNSVHEGFAVLLEEVEELKQESFWGEKQPGDHKERLRAEAVQVAAMAIRFIQELT